jgi:16S rRNA (cytidine1402-2'-O)-methyltransferase
MPGTLFVVATPIGNLEDLTFRALRVLKEVDLIAAEDTRRTSKLLAHYAIDRPLTSYREHNEARETPRLLARLDAGVSIALVSDAGTPGIADPGARLVGAALDAGYTVVPIPGASAVTAALSVSGVEADEFVFMGFPPASGAARRRWFERLAAETRPVVLFEAPHRIERTWHDIRGLWSHNRIMSCRELTKLNEELVVSHNKTQSEGPKPKGEFVLVVSPSAPPSRETREISADTKALTTKIYAALEAAGFDRDETFALTGKATGLDARHTKKIVKASRMLAKRPSG